MLHIDKLRPTQGPGLIDKAEDMWLKKTNATSKVAPLEEPDILVAALELAHSVNVAEEKGSPISRVAHLLEDDEEDSPSIFAELMVLQQDEIRRDTPRNSSPHQDFEDAGEAPLIWREQARWIKYEETVEEEGTRFSKPHIPLLNIQDLLQLKNCLKHGSPALLDVVFDDYEDLVDQIIAQWENRRLIHMSKNKSSNDLRDVLLAEKRHVKTSAPKISMMASHLSRIVEHVAESEKDLESKWESSMRSRDHSSSLLVASNPNKIDSESEQDRERKPSGPDQQKAKQQQNVHLLKKLPAGSESAMILVGTVDFLTTPITDFVRFREPEMLYPAMPEIDLPTRFMFILLIPSYHPYSHAALTIGRVFGCLMIDDVFARVAYKALENHILANGIEEFLSKNLLIAPGKWDPEFRLEPNEDMKPAERPRPALLTKRKTISTDEGELPDNGLSFTGKPFGGLITDIKRKSKFYLSDFTDAIRGRPTQIVAASLLLFIANVTKIITFGGVMGKMLKGRMGAVENLLSGCICGTIYGLFAGQPLAALSATGPTLVFEFIMFDICGNFGWDFLAVRFWVGVWTAVFLIIIVATDASVIVALITRFTEEAFATLISVIFIIQAFEEIGKIGHDAPVVPDPLAFYGDPCVCNMTQTNGTEFGINSTKGAEDCLNFGGALSGKMCSFKPDVFLFSVILFFGTFLIAVSVKWFRHSGFLPAKLRDAIADLNVTIAVVSMTLVGHFVGVGVPKLGVPEEFKPTMDRSWLINPMDIAHWWIIFVAIIPGLFFTILVFMDQQITAVIVNRKDNLLRKSFGYHLDLLIISVLMVVCGTFGIPFYVAATIISIIHLESLRVRSQAAAPGEKPKFLGVNEQRVTAVVAHILIGLTITLTSVMRLIPLPVLLGIFLYMGVVALAGQQFVQRILIFFMPTKYQPDYTWLRVVHLHRVHIFTIIQIASLLILFAVKYTKSIAIAFPFMLVVMMIIRSVVLARIFTRKELHALDDITPSIRQLFKKKRQFGFRGVNDTTNGHAKLASVSFGDTTISDSRDETEKLFASKEA